VMASRFCQKQAESQDGNEELADEAREYEHW